MLILPETSGRIVSKPESSQSTFEGTHLQAEANHPNFLERQLNVAKEIGLGALDRLKEDVIDFADHPLRSTAEIAGTAIVGGVLAVGAMEVGAATAVYAGVDTLSTELGALFGASAATLMVAPFVQKSINTGASDWSATSDARKMVETPANFSDVEVLAAKNQIRRSLGSDVGALTEAAALIATGAGASRAISLLTNKDLLPLSRKGTTSGESQLSPEIALNTSPPPELSQPEYVHLSDKDNLTPRDVAAGHDLKPGGLWFSADNQWAKTMSQFLPEIRGQSGYRLDLSDARILEIQEREDLDGLIARYGIAPRPEDVSRLTRSSAVTDEEATRMQTLIDWEKVAKNWDGINFKNVDSRSLYKDCGHGSCLNDAPSWFNSLDVDSGVVWNASKVKVVPIEGWTWFQ